MFPVKEEGLDLRDERRGVPTNMASRDASLARGKKGSVELFESEVNREEVRGIEVSEGGFN